MISKRGILPALYSYFWIRDQGITLVNCKFTNTFLIGNPKKLFLIEPTNNRGEEFVLKDDMSVYIYCLWFYRLQKFRPFVDINLKNHQVKNPLFSQEVAEFF